MMPVIDLPQMRAWLQRRGLATVMAELVEAIRADYLRWPEFEKSARVASHSPAGVIELMPASDGQRYGFKYVNGHPANGRAGLLTVTGFGVLADVATGYPVLLSEMTLATALRTAATSVLAASVMARADARTMALIGNGAQSEFQALAFHRVLGIDTIRAFDVDPSATRRLMTNLANIPGLRVVAACSAADAARGADIVTTATADKCRATVLQDADVAPGMHLNAIGGDCPGKTELDPRIVARSRVVVEFEAQTRAEGEIQHMPAAFEVTPLWAVLAGEATGRGDAQEVTLFDSVGFALEDFSTLCYLHAQVERGELGVPLSLIPALDDPRDLFSLVAPPAVSACRAA